MNKVMTEEQVRVFGEQLGNSLQGGEVLELVGDVGAGKTTLTKAIARGMGINDNVQSPTFTISQTYEAVSHLRLAHYDFYRLDDIGIMRDELAEMTRQPDVVTIIEWGEKVRDVLPDDYMEIAITPVAIDTRRFQVRVHGVTKNKHILELRT